MTPTLLQDAVNADPALIRRGRLVTGTLRIDVGDEQWFLDIVAGRIESASTGPRIMPTTRLVLSASPEEWEQFWRQDPRPGHHDVMALFRRRTLTMNGDTHLFMSNLRYFKDVLEKPRTLATGSTA